MTGGAVLSAAALARTADRRATATAACRRSLPLARGGRRREGDGVGQREECRDARRAHQVAPLHAGLRARPADHRFEGSHRPAADPRRPHLQLLAGRRARARPLAPHVAEGLPHRQAHLGDRDRHRCAGEGREDARGRSAAPTASSRRIACCLVRAVPRRSDAHRNARIRPSPTKQWIKNGFRLPEAKTSTAWVDENTLLVGTDFGSGSMTTSGYARTVRLWKRGTPIASARDHPRDSRDRHGPVCLRL